MSINRNAFAGKLLDARYKLFVELAMDQPVSGLFIGQDSRTQSNVYVRLLSGPEQNYGAYAETLESCLTLKDQRIVDVASYGRTEDLVYYVVPIEVGLSQYRTLAEVLRQEGSLSIKRAVNIASQLAAGLERAATEGIIHGNLTPKSILLSGNEQQGEQVKIWDFGTASGVPTPYGARYSAPERLNGQPTDIRSDIYSLGIILYEICTGELPILAACDNIDGWKLSHNRAIPRSCQEVEPSAPDYLAELMMDCLKKEPVRRPQSMSSLFQALCIPKQSKVKLRSEVAQIPPKRPLPLVAGLIGAVLLGGGLWGISQGSGSKSAPVPVSSTSKTPTKRVNPAKPQLAPRFKPTVAASSTTPKRRIAMAEMPTPKRAKAEKAHRKRIAAAPSPDIIAPLRFAPEPVAASSVLRSSPHPVAEVPALRGAPTPLKP